MVKVDLTESLMEEPFLSHLIYLKN